MAHLLSSESACAHRNHYAIRLRDKVRLGLVSGESCISRYRLILSVSNHVELQSTWACQVCLVCYWIDDENPTPCGAQLTKVFLVDWYFFPRYTSA